MKFYPKEFLNTAKQAIFTYNLCIFFPKKSCLTDAVNEQLNYLISGGFTDAWIRKYVNSKYLKPIQAAKRPRPVKNSNLSGAYLLLIYFLSGATFVFLLEILSQKLRALQKILNSRFVRV